MRKLNFNFNESTEILTREQLKQIMGGTGSGCQIRCNDGESYQDIDSCDTEDAKKVCEDLTNAQCSCSGS